ncbi:exported hypothetical protein [Candidatus Sulfopaludibacter sp. SbA6]|nr:exported hypothetical protein [Candidatus Sulfopaludibacter sp. SbA6]
MRITPRVPSCLALAVLVLAPLAIQAQFRHPRYLRARSDLRRATLLMRLPDEPNVMRDMQEAAGFVERAIREIDVAAAFDRRDIDENPQVDTRLGRGSRFREILRLLPAASAKSCAFWMALAAISARRRTTPEPPSGATAPLAGSTMPWTGYAAAATIGSGMKR